MADASQRGYKRMDDYLSFTYRIISDHDFEVLKGKYLAGTLEEEQTADTQIRALTNLRRPPMINRSSKCSSRSSRVFSRRCPCSTEKWTRSSPCFKGTRMPRPWCTNLEKSTFPAAVACSKRKSRPRKEHSSRFEFFYRTAAGPSFRPSARWPMSKVTNKVPTRSGFTSKPSATKAENG